MKKNKVLISLIISAIILALPWYKNFSGILLFFAFIPLLSVEQHLYENKQDYGTFSIFKYSFLTFFIWNLAATWWIYNATLIGIIAAVLINSLLMSLVIWLFHLTKRRFGTLPGYFSLVFYWIGFEYFYYNSEISFPWLTLGNGFAKNIKLVQWYEFTGVLGGSLWVLLVNILLFFIIVNSTKNIKRTSILFLSIICFSLIIIPISWSIYRFSTYQEIKNPYSITILQPNVDPYNEKFTGLSNYEQLQILLKLAEENTNDSTDYVVGPETSIDDNIWESEIANNFSIKQFENFIKRHPNAAFVTGISSYKKYGSGEKLSPTARELKSSGIYYDSYNTAIQVDSTNNIQLYHKSKLVTGVETMPYPRLLKFLGKIALNMGGITGSMGTQEERAVFTSSDKKNKVAPVICYESVYGEYVTDYIKKGGNMIFIITNDGWWGDTPGYMQHLSYAQIRAIETRRSFARSANTGISCFINQKGEVIQPTSWWVRTGIKGTINANSSVTFYTKHGDYIGSTAVFLSIILIASNLAHFLLKCFR